MWCQEAGRARLWGRLKVTRCIWVCCWPSAVALEIISYICHNPSLGLGITRYQLHCIVVFHHSSTKFLTVNLDAVVQFKSVRILNFAFINFGACKWYEDDFDTKGPILVYLNQYTHAYNNILKFNTQNMLYFYKKGSKLFTMRVIYSNKSNRI